LASARADWTDRYVAHRCSPGVVVLFTTPFLELCPACGEYTEGRGKGPRPSIEAKPRGRPFGNDTDSAADTALIVPPSGADDAASAAQMVPLLSTISEHHETGLLTRDEEGLQEEVGFQSSSEGLEHRRDAEIDAEEG
jgi:hypothetical protein